MALSARPGHPVALAYEPSVLCDLCQRWLRALRAALPAAEIVALVDATVGPLGGGG